MHLSSVQRMRTRIQCKRMHNQVQMNQPLSLSLPLRISARIHPSSLSSRVTQTRTLDTLHSRTRVHVFCRVRLTSERSKTITRRGVVADLLADLFFFFFFHAVVPRPLNGDTTRSNRITRARDDTLDGEICRGRVVQGLASTRPSPRERNLHKLSASWYRYVAHIDVATSFCQSR